MPTRQRRISISPLFSSLVIGSYLAIQWTLKLLRECIKRDNDLSLSLEKIAQFQLSMKRTINGVMLTLMVACGALLFSLMTSRKLNENLVLAIGVPGLVAGTICFLFEVSDIDPSSSKVFATNSNSLRFLQIKNVTEMQSRRRRQTSQLQRPVTASVETQLVDGCSPWLVAVSFFVTLMVVVLIVIYAITLEIWAWKVSLMAVPVGCSSLVIGLFLKPRDEGAMIKVLHAQYFTFIVGSLGALGE